MRWRIKNSSVNVLDLNAEITDAIDIVASIYNHNNAELVITSGKDGIHGKNSLHYIGDAIDIRIWNIKVNLENLTKVISKALGDGFDVVLEKDHIHIEYDPK